MLLEAMPFVDVKGVKKVKGVVIMDLDQRGTGVRGDAKTIDCDLVAVSGGWNPTVPPTLTVGWKGLGSTRSWEGSCRVNRCSRSAVPVPVRGAFDLVSCIGNGLAAGAGAARETGFGDGVVQTTLPATDDMTEEPPQDRMAGTFPQRSRS